MNKIYRITISIAFFLLVYSFGVDAATTKCYKYLYKDLPFEMPVLKQPKFPRNQVSIVDFGGVSDGITLNTDAFSNAIDFLSKKGGGTLNIPIGIWFTGPITFKSNINLHLEKGSLILFSPDKKLYPLVDIIFEGLDTYRCQSPISGRNLTNVAITGEGSIDGNGQYWRALSKRKVTESEWKEFTSKGGVFARPDSWVPSKQFLKGQEISEMNVPETLKSIEDFEAVHDFLRPVMVSFYECKNVLLQGVLFQNSPAWNLHPLMCENVIVDNVNVRNPSYSQNGDGIDLESCKNSIIVNSTFDCGDDGICIKSGKDEDGRRHGRPCENLIVENCTVFKGHGGFVVGSEMSGGVRNIKVSNCSFLGTDVGLRFKSKRGRGGLVENIYVDNITMMNIVTEPLLFDLFYGGKSASEALADDEILDTTGHIPSVDETTPSFQNIYIKDINCSNARRAMYFNGLPEMNIKNINVENVNITSSLGAELCESDGIKFRNIHINSESEPALKLYNVKNFDLSGFSFPDKMKDVVIIGGSENKNINLPNTLQKESISYSK
ncbi:MAG: glycoside hydrolase family 28 protein [Paludibacter sp.]|nr:glycoside hydrolase family 28 protein [Paludibacter sp.]